MAPFDGVGTAHLDAAHVGDIHGAFGKIAHDHDHRGDWKKRLLTLLAIIGPGLIVMVGDNDAGAFGTYTQAAQNYGTSLLWTLLLLVPVLYVNQEMVLRLGAVTGVGHARLIFARFGKFWGAFSVIDLFLLNALTIVTEFIGVSLGLSYLGLPKFWGVVAAAVVTVLAASTGSFRRFERFMMALVFGSLALVPVLFMIHPPASQVVHDFLVPQLPKGGRLSEVMLLIIAIVGTTIAPWQLFFQQSYVIDKRITPRFIGYEKVDLWLGILFVILGAGAMMAFTAAAFAGRPEFGHFTDAAGVARGLEHAAGKTAGVFFAVALIDASIIGAGAVSLSTAYAIGDVFKLKHSLHRKASDAVEFYLVYGGLIALAAALVLIPGTPLGLLTNAVQTLAGVLLPSATVFLLLLCNDKTVLGPWVNGRWLNLFTGAVIAALVMLSVILTASVLYPELSSRVIVGVLIGGGTATVAAWAIATFARRRGRQPIDRAGREDWRMPPLQLLPPLRMSGLEKAWMGVLRAYLAIAGGLVLVRIVQLAISRHTCRLIADLIKTQTCSEISMAFSKRAVLAAVLAGAPTWAMAAEPTGDAPGREETWAVHGQTTFVQQAHVAFHSPYQGTNSLAPEAVGRETFDATLYAGVRRWAGGEIWINPEIDQGFGLSNTLGVAGFPSGEAYKVGKKNPYPKLPRLFLRQTINLGGEREKVDPDLNQLGGSQTADRLVLTVGKFSVVDIFDTNQYAHDPRRDFLNWAVIDVGAFDYAANAWGYTYGAAAELYRGRWALRAGAFDLSNVPNSARLDATFTQFQLIGELEERHEIGGQPGKLKVTVFESRGRMGRFADAVRLAEATGQPADIAAVRQYRSRRGVSFNLEQQVSPGLGLFMKGGVAGGDVEPYEFADIDRTIAAGASVKGSRWGRADDTWAIAGVINGVPRPRAIPGRRRNRHPGW